MSERVRVRGIPFRLPEAEKRGGCCCPGVCSSTVAPVQQQQQVEKMHCSFYRGVPRVAHRVHDRLRAVSASHGTSRTVTVPLSASEQLPAAVQRIEPAIFFYSPELSTHAHSHLTGPRARSQRPDRWPAGGTSSSTAQ